MEKEEEEEERLSDGSRFGRFSVEIGELAVRWRDGEIMEDVGVDGLFLVMDGAVRRISRSR